MRVLEILAQRAGQPGEAMAEAGCWNGGSTAKFSVACTMLGYRLHVYDSFKGVESHHPDESEHDFSGEYAASLDQVRANVEWFGSLGVCEFHPGWFSETLNGHPLEYDLRIAYIDCDLPKGTLEALSSFRPALVTDGVIFSQDCHIPSVRVALPGQIQRLGDRLGIAAV